MRQGKILHGLDPTISARTVKTAKELLYLAETGECIGFAFGAILKGGRYARGYTGIVVRQPEVTIGILHRVIDDLIAQAEGNSVVDPGGTP